MQGKLITFEGIECSGKGTQIKLLLEYLKQNRINAVMEHEPGGTLYGEALRAILKFPDQALLAIYNRFAGHSDFPLMKYLDSQRTPECELFMFAASRAEFSQKLKREIQMGINVVSDRLMDSSVAYQGYGRGLDVQGIKEINKMAMNGLWPDLTLFLDIPVEVMLERVGRENDEKNSFFEKTCDRKFFQRVRNGYLEIAKADPQRVKVIDGAQSKEQVFADILKHVNELFM